MAASANTADPVRGGRSGSHITGPWAGVPATGWVWHEDDAVLVHLLRWLDLAMPRINRVAPIAKHYLNRAV